MMWYVCARCGKQVTRQTIAHHEYGCLPGLATTADYKNPHDWRNHNIEVARRMGKADSKIDNLTSDFCNHKKETDRYSTSIADNKQDISKHTQVLKAYDERIDSYDRK